MRQSWREYFTWQARIVSKRSACTRRQVGAVVVKDNRAIGSGYNGFPPGMTECSDGGCPRGQHYVTTTEDRGVACGCGNSWPCPDSAEPIVSSYDTGPGSCWSTHAEINAIMQTGWAERQGATLYVSTGPCTGCLKIIASSGIVKVIWPDGELEFPFLSCYTPAEGDDDDARDSQV